MSLLPSKGNFKLSKLYRSFPVGAALSTGLHSTLKLGHP